VFHNRIHDIRNVNADPAELAKFSELAHRWWDPESEFRPLHEINPLRLEWIDNNSRRISQKVLDIGCGGGILADSMARKGADVLGVDLATKALGGAAACARGQHART
jgi:2-polyprenyl-6-hydroxyphenyl methylase/3-demethylubiquinone-9 3-methyltransferase